jgi:meso-butanediol dehydrogenase / (S,S)-butanediol dehydrogenase / diacetyl reductase
MRNLRLSGSFPFAKGGFVGRLDGKIALITGAGGGLGSAMAKLFAAEGARLFLCDLDAAAAEAAAAAVTAAGGRAEGMRADVSAQVDVDAVIAAVKRSGDRLHIVVNNAGNLLRADFRHMEDADWEKVLNPHLWGTIRITRAALPLLTAAGGASVVNLSSIMASQHARQLSAYSTAKAAIAGLSRSLAVELAPYNIRVNYMCPGFIPTQLTDRYTSNPHLAKALLAQMPMRRFGTPEEVAKVALFLASDDSAYTTGEGIMVDGGMSLNLA